MQWIKPFHEALKTMGIDSVFYASPATAQEWLIWCRDLLDFAPRLFRD
jgi:hypothetical protein